MIRTPIALLCGGAIAACLMSPAVAQTGAPADTSQAHQIDPHQPQNDGSAAASATVAPGQIAPGVDPGTSSANADVNGAIAANQMGNATAQGQYAVDMANYDQAMRENGHQIARQDAHYARQQQAYASAMDAWRAQVAACKHGHQAACNAPPPDPANFY